MQELFKLLKRKNVWSNWLIIFSTLPKYLINEFFPNQSPPTEKQIQKNIDKILNEFINQSIKKLADLDDEYSK